MVTVTCLRKDVVNSCLEPGSSSSQNCSRVKMCVCDILYSCTSSESVRESNIKLKLCTRRDVLRVFMPLYPTKRSTAYTGQVETNFMCSKMSDPCLAGVMLLWSHVLTKTVSSSASVSAGIHLDSYCLFFTMIVRYICLSYTRDFKTVL